MIHFLLRVSGGTGPACSADASGAWTTSCLESVDCEECWNVLGQASRAATLDLLVRARAQGVHHLEVGPEGIKADMLPQPPASLSQPRGDTPAETPEQKLERELFPE